MRNGQNKTLKSVVWMSGCRLYAYQAVVCVVRLTLVACFVSRLSICGFLDLWKLLLDGGPRMSDDHRLALLSSTVSERHIVCTTPRIMFLQLRQPSHWPT